jgi:hypothetical protein
MLDDLEAAQPGHPPVDDRDLVVVGTEVEIRCLAVGHSIHHVSVLAEATFENGAQRSVILGDEYSHPGPTRVSSERAIASTVLTNDDDLMTTSGHAVGDDRHGAQPVGRPGAFLAAPLDQREGQTGTAGDRPSGVIDQVRGYAVTVDDREAPRVEADALGQQFGADPFPVAGGGVDDEVEPVVVHRDDASRFCGITRNGGAVV